MPKPKIERQVQYPPKISYFKPQGIPFADLLQVVLSVDEYEAIRLTDYEGLDQEKAAKELGVSRPTCARIVEQAHRKIAEAITQGKAIVIEGGSFVLRKNLMRCTDCGNTWEVAVNAESDEDLHCPACSRSRIVDLGARVRGHGMGRGGGRHGRGGRRHT